ncbi:EAL domain-containing protein [Klebsiella variicola subsp. variicola]|nr:EAL domain-containing protein [Klebsiella variicola subsp. variicola]
MISNTLCDSIRLLRLEPLVNLKSNRIVAFEVLSEIKAEMKPETWFARLKPCDAIAILKFQIERISELSLREECFYNLSIATIVELNENDIQFITSNKEVSIEISDTYNMRFLNATSQEVLFNNLDLLRAGGAGVWLDDLTFDDQIDLGLYKTRIDGVKIDKCELRNSWLGKKVAMIYKTLDDINIIIEGIESESDLSLAREAGIKIGQGYLWSVDNLIVE